MHRFFSLLAVLAIVSAGAAHAKTLNVPSHRFPTPAVALAAAHSGDSIHINSGTYNQSLNVVIDNVSIIAFNGAGLDGTGLDASVFADGVHISSERVTIQGLRIKNFTYGINVLAGGNRFLTGNVISNCDTGIICSTGIGDGDTIVIGPSTMDGNSVSQCGSGIVIDFSENVAVTHNNIYGNGLATAASGALGPGIFVLDSSANCTLDHNVVTHNVFNGISVDSGTAITVSNNLAAYNGANGMGDGISLSSFAVSCSVHNNLVLLNGLDGIRLDGVFFVDNDIEYNIALGNSMFDAEDSTMGGSNTWAHNLFGSTSGIY